MKARENPFATGRVEERLVFDPALVGTSWEALEERWEELGRRACVVGPHGSGKTTFLDAFAARLDQPVARFFFNENRSVLMADDCKRMETASGQIWIVDGDRHLRWDQRRRFYEAADRAAGILSARHWLAGMPALIRLKPNLELAERLLERVSADGAVRFREALPRLYRHRRGNLREVWLDCYDLASS